MSFALGSKYVYHGESEEEVIPQRALDEGMWASDDDDDDDEFDLRTIRAVPSTAPPQASRTRSGFWGSFINKVKRKTTRRKSKAPSLKAANDKSSSESEEEEVRVKPPKTDDGNVDYSEIQHSPPEDPEPTPSVASVTAIASPPSPKRKIKKQKRQRLRWNKSGSISKGVKTRRADTNILAVQFNQLREAGHIHTGDAQFCSNPNCGAVVSHLTKLIGEEDAEKRVWNCEYCGTATEVDIVNEEIPTEEDTTYLITPASIMAAKGGAPIAMDESLVVFCIDTSGSMCVTTEVPGQYKIRGAKEREEKLLQSLPTSIAHDLRQPEHRIRQGTLANSTYISRMESLQAAVDTHLSKLVHSEPNKRVSIVTFSDDVTIMGDGRMVPVTIAGDKLSDSKAVIDSGKEIPLPSTIRETQKALSKKIYSLEESGQTALGPAALASVVIASQKPGSRVVLCTDGLANVGLGSLDVGRSSKAYVTAENFYEDLGDIAMDKGVTVSLLTIKGTDCRVAELGQVATRTGGQVTIVDPLTVTEEFGSILSNPIIATDVVTKIIVHNGMYFRTEDSKENVIVKQVGNVTADTEITYEYGVRKVTDKPSKKLSVQPKIKEEKEEEDDEGDIVKSKGDKSGASPSSDGGVPPQMIDGQPHLPFQLQIEYTNSDGDRCLRVITKAKPITTDRVKAEKEMDSAIISSHVGKKAAELTMHGEFTKARVSSLASQRMLQEHSRTSTERRRQYNNFCDRLVPLENELHRMQLSERSRGRNHSDNEEEYQLGSDLMSTSYAQPSRSSHIHSSGSSAVNHSSSRSAREMFRRQEMPDELALDVYRLCTDSSTSYNL
ncbi:PREDICTED: circularly permutated Ras protein 1-like [Amphimedon queenslandica]|uniref:Sec23/Sec24 trunk domain-containing protein n=1 Tax=Amphimedon queenslandica TaxID=400682 RepID=A0A1X7VVL1_AMPQE|nr:PREDICTED: circularly permutated Ras protein 1-like [Amphimedon queenslandica]|eukprot:XP_003382887.1 PREDICTED: circularly permutated Ras protein 1-like [Amphimedon queenslandica]